MGSNSTVLSSSCYPYQYTQVIYQSCSKVVDEIMAADTMQSVKHLLSDVLEHIPVLLYQVRAAELANCVFVRPPPPSHPSPTSQGQYDILDGPASCTSWINTLEWSSRRSFNADPGSLWRHGGHVAGWRRHAGRLTHVIVYRAGEWYTLVWSTHRRR